jgi:hypothetical protein
MKTLETIIEGVGSLVLGALGVAFLVVLFALAVQ